MTSEKHLWGPQDPDEDINEVFEWGHPNPGRVGCPPREVLIALARRERSSQDKGYEHVANCSPCYREFLAEVKGRPVASRNRRGAFLRPGWLAAAAALVLAAVVGTWWFLAIRSEEQAGEEVRRREAEAQIGDLRLDLRPYVVMRGVEGQKTLEPLSLTRSRLRLTMLLPAGFRPGEYEVQIVDSEMRDKGTAIGHAEIRQQITTLQATIDLRLVEPGQYRLALRQGAQTWRMFPVLVR